MEDAGKDEREFESSKLGTKEYWDNFYDNELRNFKDFGDNGMVWFGKVAENRMLKFMNNDVEKTARVIDLGCGNGSMLKKLHTNGFTHLCGVDYSETAVEFAKQSTSSEIEFRVADLCSPATDATLCNRFDIILDKGTWDAISLADKDQQKLLEAYRRTIEELFAADSGTDQFFVIISCNFTLEELKSKFASDRLLFHKELPAQATFSFGGQTGQTTSGAVFRFNCC